MIFFSLFSWVCILKENTEAFISLQIPHIPFPLSPHISYQPSSNSLYLPDCRSLSVFILLHLPPHAHLSCASAFFFFFQPLSLLAVSISSSHYLTTFLISMHLQLFHQFHKYEMGGLEHQTLWGRGVLSAVTEGPEWLCFLKQHCPK